MVESPHGLRRHAASLTLGHAILTGGQWVTLAIIARLAGAEPLGGYALALGVASPVFLLANLGLRTVQATDVGREANSPFVYLGLRAFTSLLAFTISIAIHGVVWPDAPMAMPLAVGVLKYAESLSDVIYGDHQRRGRMDRIAVSSALRGVSLAASVFFALKLEDPASHGVLLGALSWLAIVVFVDWSGMTSSPKPSKTAPRGIWAAGGVAALAWPMGSIDALDSLNSNSVKYLLELLVGLASVGMYTAALSVVLAGGVLLSGLGHAALPRIAEHWRRGDVVTVRALAVRLTSWVVSGGLVLTFAALLFGEDILVTLFGPALQESGGLLFFLFLAGTLWYGISVWGYVLNGMRVFKPQLPLFVAMTCTCVATGLLLIPAFGVYGAAWAYGASLGVRAVGTWWIWRMAIRAQDATLV